MINYIFGNFIDLGYLFADRDFRAIALQAYAEKCMQVINPLDAGINDFLCSDGFISDFKFRHDISSRAVHYKRRPTGVSEEQKQHWIDHITLLLQTAPLDRIINCDETAWLVWPKGLLTWNHKGATDVHVTIPGCDKDSLTVTAAVTASGIKLPLQILAKGLTNHVHETQIGDIGDHWRDHSASRWQTELTFEHYLIKLSEHIGNEPFHLLLDLYSTHRTNHIKQLAVQLGITLHFIPPGMTDQFQPLDRKVFGELKAIARRLFHEGLMNNPNKIRDKASAVQDLLCAWEHVGSETVEDAWGRYRDAME
jgi:hypothetical protein